MTINRLFAYTRIPRIRPALTMALCAATLAGCAVGPDYVQPPIDVPATYKEDSLWKTAKPSDEYPRGAWWSVFKDPELDRLMVLLNKQNLTIAQAEAQYRQAQALLATGTVQPLPEPVAGRLQNTRFPVQYQHLGQYAKRLRRQPVMGSGHLGWRPPQRRSGRSRTASQCCPAGSHQTVVTGANGHGPTCNWSSLTVRSNNWKKAKPCWPNRSG